MKINYFRYPNIDKHDPWQECHINSDTDLSALKLEPLVSINGQPVLRQHHSTYLTGKDTCRAHHFAKLLASAVLSGQCPNVPSAQVHDSVNVTIETSSKLDNKSYSVTTRAIPRSVLWIDTVHGPHISTQLYSELAQHATSKENLHLICLDVLGAERDNVYALNRNIEDLISKLNPALVVIDDIDHFMPFCGVNTATEFCRIVRDVTNHSETAFLFIGYNHLGKKAGTTGNLGKYLFIDASTVFSLNTQREVTTVRLVRSFDLSRTPDDTEFLFTIGSDNLPHEAAKVNTSSSRIDDNTLRGIITDVLQPGDTITPDDLYRQVNAQLQQHKRQHRAQLLVDQALRLNILKSSGDSFNNSLTLPPLPSTPSGSPVPGHCHDQSSPSSKSSPSSPSSPSSKSTPSSKQLS